MFEVWGMQFWESSLPNRLWHSLRPLRLELRRKSAFDRACLLDSEVSSWTQWPALANPGEDRRRKTARPRGLPQANQLCEAGLRERLTGRGPTVDFKPRVRSPRIAGTNKKWRKIKSVNHLGWRWWQGECSQASPYSQKFCQGIPNRLVYVEYYRHRVCKWPAPL